MQIQPVQEGVVQEVAQEEVLVEEQEDQDDIPPSSQADAMRLLDLFKTTCQERGITPEFVSAITGCQITGNSDIDDVVLGNLFCTRLIAMRGY